LALLSPANADKHKRHKGKEITMRAERPLIASIVFLATGLSLVFGYCRGATSINAAYPLAASVLHFDITTTGPAALGGIALIGLGLLLLVWALLAAIVGQIGLLAGNVRDPDRIVPSERILE
jgi:hypothetical protein